MTSTYYWDLYVCYVKQCEKENYINDIDPNHYQMEWNHFWPQCIFGDWPVGQWLTLKQHSIASALQTLVFKRNCMCGWHKSYLPPALLELAWSSYCEFAKNNGAKGAAACHAEKDENGKSLHSLKLHTEKDENGKSLHNLKLHAKKDENGKSLHTLKINAKKDENGKSVNALKGLAVLHAEKDEDGKSVLGVKNAQRLHLLKDENGKCVNSVKGGIKAAAALHSEKDENGKSLHSLKLHTEKDENGKSLLGIRSAAIMHSQLWQSTVDGFTGRANGVALHNKANGWPKDARVRLS